MYHNRPNYVTQSSDSCLGCVSQARSRMSIVEISCGARSLVFAMGISVWLFREPSSLPAHQETLFYPEVWFARNLGFFTSCIRTFL